MGQIIICDFVWRDRKIVKFVSQDFCFWKGIRTQELSHTEQSLHGVLVPIFYKISDVKQWLSSVTWSFSRINFIVSLICASYNRNVVFFTEALYANAASMGQIIGAFVWTDRIAVKFVSQDCLLLDMDSNPRTLTYRTESILCFWYQFLYKILDFKQWLPSVTWSLNRNNFIVTLIRASYNRNVVFLTEA